MSDIDLAKALGSFNKGLEGVLVDPLDIYFEERVKLSCYYCPRYNTKWTCPPRIPSINFPRIFKEYKNGLFVICKMDATKERFEDCRVKSSLLIHKALLNLEQKLYESNCSLHASFLAGSCKLCRNGCNKESCNNPGLARIPLEATGVNVIKTLEKKDISITFPVTSTIVRVGLILW